ncbi:OmpA family protein [Saccharicrinis fermentans]|uniref:Inner membrane lipoprotein YiaD n=1 Tax=Saccharicrinis fermentans DSM 9555 = JCM 21142 TaxID=869213 RepID=W7YPF2_9BACT|nr:OmpA family protein [Saccharicrinis fermentans]GAF04259.1 inner membrane lipoprotein YiaD precursor [Saccharicrinis fermentans DSM 9555 = JCM 21142]
MQSRVNQYPITKPFISMVLIIVMAGTVITNAQKLSTRSKKAATLYHKGLSFYKSGNYNSAKIPLAQALEKDSQFIEAHLLMSEVHFEQKNFVKQIEYLENVVNLDSTFFIFSYYNLGVAHFHIKNFKKAESWFKKYYNHTRDDGQKKKVEEWLTRVEFAHKAIQKPVIMNAKNLGSAVNTPNNEYWPSITADEQVLVYTVMVKRDSVLDKVPYANAMANLYHEDFFRSVKDESGEWSNRTQLSAPLNTMSNEGAQTLSSDGNWMFFTACGRGDSKGSCDIYFSQRTATGWSAPKNIGAPVNTPYWESQPSFSSDGRTLYYTSNRSGGKGGNDIWRASLLGIKSDGTPFFGKPENLGNKINTPSNEISPFIHPDNRTLYFASEGWPGMGKADLFMSRMNNGIFDTDPVNLGVPINTEDDEVGLIVTASGKTAYFSSDRLGDSFGGRDIYSFEMPEKIRPLPVSYVKGRIFDIRTKEKLKASLELSDLNKGQMVVHTLSSGFTGEFLVCLPANGSYALSVSKKGYLFYSDHFQMDSTSTVQDPQILDIYLKPLEIGEQVVLNNIFYETDSYELKSESEVELKKLLLFLEENSHTKIQILGYTDNVGAISYNQKLSMLRAKQVYQYLVDEGVDAQRLSYKGEGMNHPIDNNDTEEGRAKNRRTEMKIVE